MSQAVFASAHSLPSWHGSARRRTWAMVVTAVVGLHAALAVLLSQSSDIVAPEPLPGGAPMAVTWLPLPATVPPVQATPAPPPSMPSTPRPAPARPAPTATTSPALPPLQPTASAMPATALPQAAAVWPLGEAPSTTAAPAAHPAPAAPMPTAPPTAAQPAPPLTRSATPPSFDAAYLDNPQPTYPAISRREGEQGQVLLRVHVLASGLADQVEVQTSSGFERLDKAARSAVARWKFTPARLGDRPVAEWVTVPIDFFLKRAQP